MRGRKGGTDDSIYHLILSRGLFHFAETRSTWFLLDSWLQRPYISIHTRCMITLSSRPLMISYRSKFDTSFQAHFGKKFKDSSSSSYIGCVNFKMDLRVHTGYFNSKIFHKAHFFIRVLQTKFFSASFIQNQKMSIAKIRDKKVI